MKRVLLLTYYLPPRAAIASVRTGQLRDMLPHFGWEVVPVVPNFGDADYGAHVRTTDVVDFKAPIRRLLGVRKEATMHERFGLSSRRTATTTSLAQRAARFGYDVAEFANSRFGWLGPGTRVVNDMLRTQHFDAILSTSPPSATHLVAARVHGKLPWIADLRDPWYRDDTIVFGAPLAALDRALEPRTFRRASALTIVSEPLAQELRSRYPATPVYAISNAFSAREWEHVPFAQPERTTFVYPGQLYEGMRDPRLFFKALAALIAEGAVREAEIAVDFYGCRETWLLAQVAEFGLESVVRFHDNRPRQEMLALERAASRLLLFLWDGPSERGTLTGKLFEYFGARRKIVAIGGPAMMAMDEMLAASGAGERHRDVGTLRAAILEAVREHRTGTTCTLVPESVAAYESFHMARHFADVLDQCTSTHRRSVS